MDDSVTENSAAHRFEMAIGDMIAAAYYRLEDGKVVLIHTEVPQQLSGQGSAPNWQRECSGRSVRVGVKRLSGARS